MNFDDKIIQLGNRLKIQGLFLEEYKEDNPEWYANLISLVKFAYHSGLSSLYSSYYQSSTYCEFKNKI